MPCLSVHFQSTLLPFPFKSIFLYNHLYIGDLDRQLVVIFDRKLPVWNRIDHSVFVAWLRRDLRIEKLSNEAV